MLDYVYVNGFGYWLLGAFGAGMLGNAGGGTQHLVVDENFSRADYSSVGFGRF